MLLKPPHVPSGSRVARSNAFTNNDLPAEEFCMYDDSFRNDGNFKHYNFRFYVPSVAYTLGWPDLSFVMHNQRESCFSGHIFDSAEQALGLTFWRCRILLILWLDAWKYWLYILFLRGK